MSKENICRAWKNFVSGKWQQAAVRRFWLNLEQELASLYHDLNKGKYFHGAYHHFTVSDTKKRDVYVATVRDKVVHRIIAEYLEGRYSPLFYGHSYAAQRGKGVTAARAYACGTIIRLYGHSQVWVGKLDVQKYFANVDHEILTQLLSRRVTDCKTLAVCQKIIESFGLRYNDDMIIINADRQKLRFWIKALQGFASESLHLTIPPHKIELVGLPEPVDILGIVTNGHCVWTRRITVKRAEARMDMKYRALAPELLDAASSYYGCGINQTFPIAHLIV